MFRFHYDSCNLQNGICVQRFFSTFADGWPGGGLLIQRLLVGTTLLYLAVICLTAAPVCAVAISRSIAALGGILLIAGLWTPFAGLLVTGTEAWIALSTSGDSEIPILLAVLGLTLAMIGPGAWSVDARAFRQETHRTSRALDDLLFPKSGTGDWHHPASGELHQRVFSRESNKSTV